MRRLVLTMSFLITAASLQAAAGQQTPEPATESAPPPKAPAMRTLTTTAPVQSPLVRAAKASPKRSKKKSTTLVITNGDLSKSGGHVTTATTALKPLPVDAPAEMTPEQARAVEKHNREVRQAAVAKTKKAEADRKMQKERAAAIYNGDDAEGMLEDPALVEGKMTPQPRSDVPPPVKPPAA
ncbi:MAG: hypothetical protein ABIP63_10100 [Thermoanaerobaculia bacterium]